MARLRFNNISSRGTANPITFADGTTTSGSWNSAPAFPTIASPDYVAIVCDPSTPDEEIVYLTAYTAGATSGTFSRAQEGSTGVAHNGVPWAHGPTAADFGWVEIGQVIPIPLTNLPAAADLVGTWAWQGLPGLSGPVSLWAPYNSSDAQNDAATWHFQAPAGSYDLSYEWWEVGANAIAHFLIDGTEVGTIDQYGGSNSVAFSGIGSFTISGYGHHTITIAALSRNASASGWWLQPARINLIRRS